jgi:hypothetical protein
MAPLHTAHSVACDGRRPVTLHSPGSARRCLLDVLLVTSLLLQTFTPACACVSSRMGTFLSASAPALHEPKLSS